VNPWLAAFITMNEPNRSADLPSFRDRVLTRVRQELPKRMREKRFAQVITLVVAAAAAFAAPEEPATRIVRACVAAGVTLALWYMWYSVVCRWDAGGDIDSEQRQRIAALEARLAIAEEQPIPATIRRLRACRDDQYPVQVDRCSALVALFDRDLTFDGVKARDNIRVGINWGYSEQDLVLQLKAVLMDLERYGCIEMPPSGQYRITEYGKAVAARIKDDARAEARPDACNIPPTGHTRT
jgi:hypothetical protein